MARKGLFTVLYGPEGVGKRLQAGILEEKLRKLGHLCRRVRYPVYGGGPVGGKLDRILHKTRENLSEEERQKLFAKNREEFEPTLKSWLGSGVTVVSENYKGTGMVWGMMRGLTSEKMEEINKGALDPDVAILIDGPIRESLPDEHPYGDEEEWHKVRKVYLQMADKYGWVRVGGDAPVLTVANRIWAVVRPVVGMR